MGIFVHIEIAHNECRNTHILLQVLHDLLALFATNPVHKGKPEESRKLHIALEMGVENAEVSAMRGIFQDKDVESLVGKQILQESAEKGAKGRVLQTKTGGFKGGQETTGERSGNFIEGFHNGVGSRFQTSPHRRPVCGPEELLNADDIG
jgi:hypothetical protein